MVIRAASDGDIEQGVLEHLLRLLLGIDSLMPSCRRLEGGSRRLGERMVEVMVACVMHYLVRLICLCVECHVGCRELIVRGASRAEVRDGLNGPCLCTPARHVTRAPTIQFLINFFSFLLNVCNDVERLVKGRFLLEPLCILLDLIDLYLNLRLQIVRQLSNHLVLVRALLIVYQVV